MRGSARGRQRGVQYRAQGRQADTAGEEQQLPTLGLGEGPAASEGAAQTDASGGRISRNALVTLPRARTVCVSASRGAADRR
jgi:hypothetical protein